MKKTLSIIAATSLLFVLAGCSQPHSTTAKESNKQSASSAQTSSAATASSKAASSTSTPDTHSSSASSSSAASSSTNNPATTSSNSSSQPTDSNQAQASGKVTTPEQAVNVLRAQLGPSADNVSLLANGTSTLYGETVFNINIYQGAAKAPSAAYTVSQDGKVTQQW
ncbi:hypothetical protein KAR50_09375 [Periweissella fabaria]|uniref:Lipoprotein n=1 Tax=Periweissella fabaria TaxID=546157 RepID=A0ABN8BKS5_9LACO|nr:hypothetical protein [Periweissella fabaria]MCM0598040.1 hypothetical protein [Periweissella fabaria]CAH0415897.1 hypothetical protein WFA24289_00195 [Periweissella fabaria]